MKKFLLLSVVAGLVGACNTSDGTSGALAFTSFSDVPSDGTVRLEGSAKTASYTVDIFNNISISSIASDNDAFAEVTYANGEVSRIRIANTGADIDLSQADGAIFTDEGIILVGGSANGEDIIVAADNVDAGFNYQTFGVWVTGYDTGAGTVGTGSFGLQTDSANIPSSGSAIYSGAAGGFITDGSDYASTISDADVIANFGTSTATVATTNTRVVDFDTGADLGAAPELNFSGSGAISGSMFSAAVSGSRTAGRAEGQFYGPGAEEVGGTFTTSGSGYTHVGSFGASN